LEVIHQIIYQNFFQKMHWLNFSKTSQLRKFFVGIVSSRKIVESDGTFRWTSRMGESGQEHHHHPQKITRWMLRARAAQPSLMQARQSALLF
jgi:hypothetical protein